jgi:outer membrane immunogenic protein
MKKLLLATTCSIAVIGAKPALSAPVYNWTGCYVGAHAGGGWGQKSYADFLTTGDGVEPPSSPTANTSGFLAGVQEGCQIQSSSNWVYGFEGDLSWGNIQGSSDPFFGGKAVFHAQTDWLGSATGRVGYAFGQVLIFGKGGAAWAHDNYQVPGTFIGPFNLTGSEIRFGWTIGAGLEWLFYQNWSAVFEYAYYDFGTNSVTLSDTIGSGSDIARIGQRIQTFTFGINYHLPPGAAPMPWSH